MAQADPRSAFPLVTIQTGLVTALWAVADLVLYITFVRPSRPGNLFLSPFLTESCIVASPAS